VKKKFLSVFLLAVLTLAACSGGGGVSKTSASDTIPAEFVGKTNPLGPDAATAGAEIFKNNCVPCHGGQGHGDGPAGAALDPKPKNLAVFAPMVGDDYLYWRINAGKEGTSMVAWKGVLTEEQIWQVVSFIRTLK
jgi:mono/diheme cytochrome c family protein